MDKSAERKIPAPLFTVFIIITGACTLLKTWLAEKNIDPLVVGYGNVLLFVISLGIFALHKKALQNPNPQVFVRSIMLGSFIKLMVIAIAVAIYLIAAGEKKSVYAVAVFMGLYIVYAVIDARVASKLNKKNGSS